MGRDPPPEFINAFDSEEECVRLEGRNGQGMSPAQNGGLLLFRRRGVRTVEVGSRGYL